MPDGDAPFDPNGKTHLEISGDGSPSPAVPSATARGSEQLLQPGDIIAGKYQIERVLGEGGMGLVFAAMHLQLREQVALKFMNASALSNPEAAARFVREARAAARLRGEHICRVLDLGETDEGARYIVIEYLDGKDLSQVLAERHAIPYTEAVDYILQACEAMAEAHGSGIVHRDLKPANLFLTNGTDGAACIKVVDFGISKLIQPETQAEVVTTTRSLMGSPLYMAPEQLVSAKDVDTRSDIWALGTVLFQLIAGRTPYEAASLPEVVAQVLHNPPPRLSSIVSDSPRKLDRVIARCLAKAKEERYGSVAELAAHLAEVVPESSHLAMRSAAVLGIARPSGSQRVQRRTGPRTIAVAVALVLLLAAGAFGLLALLGSNGSELPTAKETSTEPPAPLTPLGPPAKSEATLAPAALEESDEPTVNAPDIADVPVITVPIDGGSARDEKRKRRGRSTAKAAAAKEPSATTPAGGDLLELDLEAPIKRRSGKKTTQGSKKATQGSKKATQGSKKTSDVLDLEL